MEHSTSPWSGLGLGLGLEVRARAGTGGTSYEIPRYRERMGWDGQERPKDIPDLDWWDVSWDPRTSYGKVGQPSLHSAFF